MWRCLVQYNYYKGCSRNVCIHICVTLDRVAYIEAVYPIHSNRTHTHTHLLLSLHRIYGGHRTRPRSYLIPSYRLDIVDVVAVCIATKPSSVVYSSRISIVSTQFIQHFPAYWIHLLCPLRRVTCSLLYCGCGYCSDDEVMTMRSHRRWFNVIEDDRATLLYNIMYLPTTHINYVHLDASAENWLASQ